MSQPSPVKLSVIVPAYNEEKLISSSLASIQKAMARVLGTEFELIVVDNASEDRTAELAAGCGARVVYEPIHQIARVRNTGAGAARGEWLLFIDADCWPEAALIEDLVGVMEDGRMVGGGSVLKMEGLLPASVCAIALWNGLSRICRWAAGSFVFCRSGAFREIGGFSEEYFAAEEIDFSRRLKRWARKNGMGFTVLYRHPLLTSARKDQLYSRGELLRGLLELLMHPRRFLRERRYCAFWYDGRR